jgi:NADP-dependent 3-hydroxy acid dehydrogenase YdfG
MKKEIVIISGGANGLGYELIKKLIQKENLVICNIDRDLKRLNQIKQEFSNKNYYDFYGDVSNEDFIIKTIKEISKLGPIGYLINNAGEPCFVLPTENTEKVLNINLKGLLGMVYLSAQVLKSMEKTGGKIINIMSSASLRGNKQESAYCATKWAEKGYTESLKVAYKGTNVKIVGVYPGGMNTQFYENNRDYVNEEKQSTFMNPSEVADIVIYNVFSENKLNVSDIVIERI